MRAERVMKLMSILNVMRPTSSFQLKYIPSTLGMSVTLPLDILQMRHDLRYI